MIKASHCPFSYVVPPFPICTMGGHARCAKALPVLRCFDSGDVLSSGPSHSDLWTLPGPGGRDPTMSL